MYMQEILNFYIKKLVINENGIWLETIVEKCQIVTNWSATTFDCQLIVICN
jgi:hypothetical protein